MRKSIERLIPRKLEVPEGTNHIIISVKRDEDLEKLHQFLMMEVKLRGIRIRYSLIGRRKIDLIVNGSEKETLIKFLETFSWIKVH